MQCHSKYIIPRKFGVKAGCLTDYEKLVKYFSELLWEIDPHYHKLKTRGMPFLESVEKNFLGFNKPASHGHAPKRLSSEPLSLKVQNLCQYTDRNYMDSSHVKPLKEMLLTVAEKVTAYLTQLEEQNVRTKRDMQKHITRALLKILLSETFLPTHRVKLSGLNASRKYEKCFKIKMYTNRSL